MAACCTAGVTWALPVSYTHLAFGAAAALPLVDALAQDPTLQRYHLMHAVRADLLEKLGRMREAREALHLAAELTQNGRERELLLARARGLAH